jgi:hypothetical protein
VTVPVTVTSVSVTANPSSITTAQTSQCSATVTGTGAYSSAVTWTATGGTITSAGVFTPSGAGTASCIANSTQAGYTNVSGSAPIAVTVPVTVTSVVASCNPSELQLPIPGASSAPTSQCTANVKGTGPYNSGVTWTASAGTINTVGLFTPSDLTTTSTVTITAVSAQDGTTSGSTTITVYPITNLCPPGGNPAVVLAPVTADYVYGVACNVDPTRIEVVVYALTNQWYVQPYADAPFTNIASDSSFATSTHPGDVFVVLLVDPTIYGTPASTEFTNPALDPNVIAWAMYPSGLASINFSSYAWGIKMTGSSQPSYAFDPGPNFWTNSPSAVFVDSNGLHLKIAQINGVWECSEVYLLQPLGYGTYTIQVATDTSNLDLNIVDAPLFLYLATGNEADNEYSGIGGLIPSPDSAQFVVQPYTVSGNIVRYVQPSTSQFTTQMEWQADHVTFTSWNGWASTPAESDIIQQWTYTGVNIPTGAQQVHINTWLLNGQAPINGTGGELVINSFSFQP